VAAFYHLWHDDRLDGKAAHDTIHIEIPSMTTVGATETKSFQSLRNDMDQLRKDGAGKGIVDGSRIDVGKSTEGRELWALKVGKNPDHKVLFTGCHHAREWISVEVPFLVAKYLIDNYADSPSGEKAKRIKHLVDNREIWFVPLVNPDGHVHSVMEDRLWRPNRKKYTFDNDETLKAPRFGGGSRTIRIKAGTYQGVDINRNYPSKNWGKETPATSRDPMDSARGTWAGPSAGSEVETQLMVSLIKDQQFRSAISYHNFSQLLLYPPAAKKDAFTQFVGQGMSKLIDANGNPYKYMSGDDLYPTTGDMLEYMYEVLPGRPNLVPELRPKESDPVSYYFSGLPEDQIEPTFKENLAAALALINCAGFDRPAAEVTIHWEGDTQVGQVVRNCWKVFEGLRLW
jgi:carboxypeptidase T